MIYVGRTPTLGDMALSAFGLLLILWTGFWFALAIGALGARFRDMGQLTSAGLTFAFFLTPVFWQPDRLGNMMFIVDFNPLAHYLNTVRGPLLGLDGVATSFLWVGGCTIAATAFGLMVFGMFARRIVYWS